MFAGSEGPIQTGLLLRAEVATAARQCARRILETKKGSEEGALAAQPSWAAVRTRASVARASAQVIRVCESTIYENRSAVQEIDEAVQEIQSPVQEIHEAVQEIRSSSTEREFAASRVQ